MFYRLKNIILFSIVISLASCKDSYQKILKSTDLDYKYDMAKKFYNKKDYFKALPLFEELLNIYKGTKSVEKVYYYYAYCYYGQGEYLMAAYHFKNLANTYPNGEYTEESHYMYAYTQYVLSPIPSLDQTYTLKAMEALQLFINLYPQSDKLEKCNRFIDKMRETLKLKSFNSAKLYYDLGYYQAASVSFENLLKEYPDIKEKENAYYLKMKADHLFAINSIANKQRIRIEKTIKSYNDFIERYPESKYIREAINIFETSNKLLTKLNENGRS